MFFTRLSNVGEMGVLGYEISDLSKYTDFRYPDIRIPDEITSLDAGC